MEAVSSTQVYTPVRTPSRIVPVYPSLDTQQAQNPLRNSQLGLDTFSPVDKNGCFAFDRVLKAGEVLKRTRKTKSWKSVHIVLRPNFLSIYKDSECTKLRHSINLSELTAIARQKDPKAKAQHVFGLFSPSRNFHLSAPSEKEAQEWVELIRQEARIDEDEEDMVFMSPTSGKGKFFGFSSTRGSEQLRRDRIGSSSSDQDFRTQPELQQSQTHLNYSGPDNGSFTDFSDTAPGASSLSLSRVAQQSSFNPVYHPTNNNTSGTPRPSFQRNFSQMSTSAGGVPQSADANNERVVYHGYLLLLKSVSGVRQWKRVWIVLRPKHVAFYKNDDEYSALRIIPMENIVDAVDIDPISKSKQFCLQIITSEERNYRLCAVSEMELSKWLGAFKSILVKRKEREKVGL